MATKKLSVNFGGRPPKYKTVKELQDKMITYLEDEDNLPFTITGLSLHLGFDSRQSFYDYGNDPKYSYTIKRARHYIENSYEKMLISVGGAGVIFALKNLGWVDKTEQEVKSNVEVNYYAPKKNEDN